MQTRPIEVDPEALLRKARKERKEAKAAAAEVQEIPEEHYTQDDIGGLAQSIEAALAGVSRHVDDNNTDDKVSEEGEDRAESQDIGEQEFNRSWGYLPPLDDEAAEIIEAIIANPETAMANSRIQANHEEFPRGLTKRNVFLGGSNSPDPYANEIQLPTASARITETKAENESHEKLWILDQARINQGSNEALFQRTLMMNLIGRHLFIYHGTHVDQPCLDLSVEEPWTCPPMPTRAYIQHVKFLTQPKPDLAVCFHREAIVPTNLWNSIPDATQNLACYEGVKLASGERIFHFLTVEAKKEKTSTDDNVGRLQSLNNASQALHNMFEFFKEAGDQATFFAKVRFFSAVASTEGIHVRIHRATREPEDGSGMGLIMPNRKDYPLRFEYRNFAHIDKAGFTRPTILEIFEKILIGYGVGILRGLIRNAAQAIVEKLENDPEAFKARSDVNFYRYGQTIIKPESRIPTPITSRLGSIRGMSIDTLRDGTTTPIQSQLPVPKQTTKVKGKKRPNSPSPGIMPDSRPAQKRRNLWSFSSSTSAEGL